MKCPNCGTENRPDVRFCRRCGYALTAAQPAAERPAPAVQPSVTPSAQPSAVPPASRAPVVDPGSGSGMVCPACGATAKPGARFCPRCGKPLPAVSQPQHPPQAGGLGAPPGGAHYAVSPPAPQGPPNYPPPVPSTTPPTKKGKGIPIWVWIVFGVAALAIIVGMVFLAVKLLGKGDDEPTDTTPTPTLTVTPTQEPGDDTTEQPTSTLPLPTATPSIIITPTEETGEPDAARFDAEVRVVSRAEGGGRRIPVGESYVVTATIANTGGVAFHELRVDIQVKAVPDDCLEARTPLTVQLPQVVQPGQEVDVIFKFIGKTRGGGVLQVNVTMETLSEPPGLESRESEEIGFSVR
ncbi:MAG: zinc ribbon domain-containing protein [Anaerolineae bacterium]|nr:zinc ribbon domain-containing protein [Anaerolineae bacterium]